MTIDDKIQVIKQNINIINNFSKIDNDTEKQIVDLYCNDKVRKRVIREKLGIGHKRLDKIFKKFNVKLLDDSKIYGKETLENLRLLLPQMAEDYKNGETIREISSKYHVCPRVMTRELNNFGILTKKRKFHSIDESYFEKINSHQKAYWLGFLYADGCNNPDNYGRISVSLQERDKYILEEFIKDTKFTGHVGTIYCAGDHIINNNKCMRQNSVYITIINQKMSNDLVKLGMFRRKSLTLQFPTSKQVPDKFLFSFILGYFDGDGTISLSTDKKGRLVAWFSVISSKKFCKEMIQVLQNKFNIKLKYFTDKKRKVKTAIVYISSIQTIKTLFDLMYQNVSFYMSRKYDKFTKFFEWRKNYINERQIKFGHFEGKWVKELN